MPIRLQSIQKSLPGMIAGIAIICAPLLVAFDPVEDNQTAAIFPPGWSHRDILLASAQADLSLIRFGSLQNIAIINLDAPESVENLRRAGAWVLLPPGALGGCLIQNSSSRTIFMNEPQI